MVELTGSFSSADCRFISSAHFSIELLAFFCKQTLQVLKSNPQLVLQLANIFSPVSASRSFSLLMEYFDKQKFSAATWWQAPGSCGVLWKLGSRHRGRGLRNVDSCNFPQFLGRGTSMQKKKQGQPVFSAQRFFWALNVLL